ncbi:hypothetical protein [Delftia acidovorans]|uniref:Uncharacterized protein n=1 Tax=Delftia acidovorans TaxID=80866 RepID=A0AAJ2R5N7_DELAC|nr:hypothetical protein [Delftia acidovorans]MDX4956276.1 hypothetical protein [Delftia acidovorans]
MTQDTKVPGMAVTALAGDIVEALLADEKDGGYDLTAGLFGPSFSALVRRWAAAEWSGITNVREISDEAIKEAALGAGAAKFYPDAQSKKPWGEEAFLVTGGFLQRFARAIHPAPAPEDPRDVDGENQAVRMFLLLYGQPGLTVARMREHMEAAGWPQVPEWATKPEAQGHLTKAGAQSWLRHLFALEIPYVVLPPLSEADEAKLLDAIKNSQPMGIEPLPATPLARRVGQRGAFQQRVQPWLMACFGAEIAADRRERNHRFLEEALETVQAAGCTASEAHQLVDYVFGRPVGELGQEVGGAMTTLAALCLANGIDMHAEADKELARVWTMVEKIRAKQAAKPKHSPLPAAAAVDALAPVQALLDVHAELLDANPYAYFELAYTRQTGWMAWITDKPMHGPVINPDRKVLARGQGDTPAEACAAAAQVGDTANAVQQSFLWQEESTPQNSD